MKYINNIEKEEKDEGINNDKIENKKIIIKKKKLKRK